MQVAQAQIIEGTSEEITTLLQQGAFAGQKLRVIVEPEEDVDLSAVVPASPFTVHDKAHLLELLQKGLNSSFSQITDETWEQRRREIHRRHADRGQP